MKTGRVSHVVADFLERRELKGSLLPTAIGFPLAVVPAGVAQEICAFSHFDFRFEQLVIQSAGMRELEVSEIRAGNCSLMNSQAPLPAEVFKPGKYNSVRFDEVLSERAPLMVRLVNTGRAGVSVRMWALGTVRRRS